MDVQSLVLIAALFANLLLLALLFEQAKKNFSIAVFAVSVGTVAAWTFSMFLYRTVAADTALFWGEMLYFTATLIPLTFLYFALSFPSATRVPWQNWILLGVPPLALAFLAFFTDFLIKDITVPASQEKQVVFGPLYSLYTLYISLYFVWALVVLLKKYRGAKGILQTQLSYILLGTLISIVFGSLFNLFLPALGDFRFNWLGNVTTLVMVALITYAIIKKRLFGIRVVVTQLLVGVLAILLLVNIFSSQDTLEYIWKTVLFVLFVGFGYMLVKSVLNEIKQRQELQQAYVKLKELDEAKSEFVSIASHQLRTPLTAIKGYISMLVEGTYGKLNPKQRKPMESVYNSNERLIRLVNDLLNVSRIESGRIKMDWQKAKLEEVIKCVVEELQIKAKEKNLKLQFEKPKLPMPSFKMDTAKVRNIVLNIIDNAIRYTNKGGITITLAPKPKNRNLELESVLITIQDTGGGMSKEELSHLFESFSRGKTGTKMWTDGAGLGLYIAKRFTQMHGGRIWAESQGKGRGSTFFVELPVQ